MFDTIISDELDARRVRLKDWHTWSGKFWVREFHWPLPIVTIRQYSGSRTESQRTGRAITITLPRYWVLLWQLWRERRRSPPLPKAKVRR